MISLPVSIRPSICMSIRPSVCPHHFRSIIWVFFHGISSSFAYILLSGMSGMGLLIGEFRQFFLRCYLPETRPFFRFRMIRSKYQWIFTKLGMWIDIMVICYGIANGQILTELSPQDMPIFLFQDDNLCKYQWIFTKLDMWIDILEILYEIANGQISSNFDGVVSPRHTHIFVSRW